MKAAFLLALLTSIPCLAEVRRFKPGDEITLEFALEIARPGDIFRFAPGTYSFSDTLRLKVNASETHPFTFEAESMENKPIFDFAKQQYGKESRGIAITGNYIILRGIEVVRAGDNGINVGGTHNRVEKCIVRECQDTGIQISAGGAYNTVEACDSFRNVDLPNRGENADGFAAKGKIGPGNVFRNCRAWENVDDGWDLWEAPEGVLIEDCIAFRNGLNLWDIADFAGDGNGFKLGGNFVAGNHTVIRCFTSEQSLRGFNLNNNTGAQTLIDCVATNCNVGFYLPTDPKDGSQHVLKGCTSINAPDVIAPGAKQEHNRWSKTKPSTQKADD